MFPLYGPGHDMNSCKVMLAQAKSMKLTWLDACGSGAGRVRFQGAKNIPAEGEDMNALASNAVKEVIKPNKILKAKASSESGSEDEQEHLNF